MLICFVYEKKKNLSLILVSFLNHFLSVDLITSPTSLLPDIPF